MATHIQKAGSDIGAWGPVHNDYHRTTNGGYEWFDIVANGNNPPTVKRYSRFQIWATDNSYSIPDVATGNNNYPQATTPTYLNSQAVFEDAADVTFTWEGTVRGEVLPAQSDGTWYLICKNCLDTDASTKGQGVYTVSKTETPTYSGQKGGYYSAGGYRVLAKFTSASGTVSALTILNYPNLPNADGTANYVLKTDGAGNISFANLSPGVFADITSLDSKVTPAGADELVINDSADAGEPKKILVSALPAVEQPYAFNGDTTGSAEVTLASVAASSTATQQGYIKIKKPCVGYLTMTSSSGGASINNATLYIRQNGAAYRATGYQAQRTSDGTTSTYFVLLQPGAYELRNTTSGSATRTATLIATGVFGGELSTASILE
jgi:hypothetical protein